ncbi:hypothetical protein D9M69_336980 [compost metagenome]|jgi:hypothetical protein
MWGGLIVTIPAEQWDKAFSILQQFERQLIPPSFFGWKFITEKCGVSKPTLWRNKEFEKEFQRIKEVVKSYVRGEKHFDQEISLKAARDRDRDHQIEMLKAQVEELTRQLNRERERVLYASMIARRKNIDPAEFLDESPVFRKPAKGGSVVKLPSKEG